MIRGRLTDDEWTFFEPFVTESGPLRGRPSRDHRRTLDAIFWIARTGAPWRDLPEQLGNWNSVHRQFRHWTASRLWDLMLAALAEGGGGEHFADDRQHNRRGVPLCRGRERGTQNQALGRSRGGFPAKIHLRANAEGLRSVSF